MINTSVQVCLVGMYVSVCTLRLPIIFFDDNQWKTDDYYVYVYVYDEEEENVGDCWYPEELDLISRGQTFVYWWMRTKERESALIYTNIIHVDYNERRLKYMTREKKEISS